MIGEYRYGAPIASRVCAVAPYGGVTEKLKRLPEPEQGTGEP